MVFTGKQQRNGADIGSPDSNNPMPGPTPTVPLMEAQDAADVRMSEGHAFMTSPAGAGVEGHEIGGGGDMMFEWDAGLAINDVEGGGSG